MDDASQVLIYDHLEQAGTGAGLEFVPQRSVPERLLPLPTMPATMNVTVPHPGLVPRCDVAGGTLGSGRWVPRELADAEVVGAQLPRQFSHYWVPYGCRLVHISSPSADRCPALKDVIYVGDSVQGTIFSEVARHIGLSTKVRDKDFEHRAEATDARTASALSGVTLKEHIGRGFRMALESPRPLPNSTPFGAYGVSSDHLPGCAGVPLVFANWGLHDLECGQACRLGNRGAVSAAAYVDGVLAYAAAAHELRGPASRGVVIRTLLPKFGELGCCRDHPKTCFDNWRWRRLQRGNQ